MKESNLIKLAQLHYTRLGCRLFRNNVGTGWVGTIINKTPRDLVLRDYRPLHSGLCKGSSDLIGWTQVMITDDMVGKTVAVFTAIECKTGRLKATRDQVLFLDAVNAAGGRSSILREGDL